MIKNLKCNHKKLSKVFQGSIILLSMTLTSACFSTCGRDFTREESKGKKLEHVR